MGRNSAAMIIAFDDSAEIIQGFTGDPRVLRNAIDTIEPTDRPTKLDDAYRLADAQAAFDPNLGMGSRTIPPDVWLYSDGRAKDAASASVHGNFHYEQVGTETANNIAVVAMNARRNYEQPAQVQVFARLANFGPEPVKDVQVQLTIDGSVQSAGSVNLLPSATPTTSAARRLPRGSSRRTASNFPHWS